MHHPSCDRMAISGGRSRTAPDPGLEGSSTTAAPRCRRRRRLEGDLDGVRVGRGLNLDLERDSVTRAAYGDERLRGTAREDGCGCGRESAGVGITALYTPSHSLRAQRRNHDLK